MVYKSWSKKIVSTLAGGGVGVIPTDTLYGLVGSALRERTVERIYDLRKRNKDKPMIVLIGSLSDLITFGVRLTESERKFLKKYWPGALSVVLSVDNYKFEYLHRGGGTVAFRMPDNNALRDILSKTGPLVAPTANIEGEKPAENIQDAMKYFGEEIDLYLDAGSRSGEPSTLITFKHDQPVVLRQGAVRLDKN